jgi:hypothetical protein
MILASSALLACWPLLANGALPMGSDLHTTAGYLQGFMKAFGEGDILPRWVDRPNQSLGSPAFIMFPPLPWYLAAAASWLSGSLVAGLKIYFVLVAALAALTFHLLAREWTGAPVASAIAAGLYLLLPYHVLDVYYRLAISETAAFVFFPLILLFGRRCIQAPGRGAFAGLALACAGLAMTHLVSAFIFSLFLGPWLLLETSARWSRLAAPALALICAAGLAAPIVLPALVEKSHVNISWLTEMPGGDYEANFIFGDDPMPIVGIRNPVKPMVLASAHSQLVMGAAAAIVALVLLPGGTAKRRRDVIVLSAACAASYLMQVRISGPVWRIVPELATIQFPFRFQTMTILTASLLSALAMGVLLDRRGEGRPASWRIAGGVLITVAATWNLYLARENAHIKPFRVAEEHLALTFAVECVEPAFTPVEFTGYRQFWEDAALKRQRIEMAEAAFVEGKGRVIVEEWKSSARAFRIESDGGGTVMIRSFWFPGWEGLLDGAPLELSPRPVLGTITFGVPPGSHRVTLAFRPTPLRSAAAGIGLASILLTVALAWKRPWLPSPAQPDPAGMPGEARGAGESGAPIPRLR